MGDSAVIYLASQSQRRRELLTQIGVDFEVICVDVDESRLPGEPAQACVARLALAKAQAGRAAIPPGRQLPVLGADTIVIANGEILGKPRDGAAAEGMLQLLSGRTHQVMTAVALDDAVKISSSDVTFRTLSAGERAAYRASGEPTGKAGGYAIQGLAAVFISRIEGSYSGVMGLPLHETATLLQESGINIF